MRRFFKWLGTTIAESIVNIGVAMILGLVGVSTLVVVLFRLLNYFRNLPQDRVIDLAIFCGSLLLLLSAYIIARLNSRDKPQGVERPQSSKPQTTSAKDEKKECLDRWLHEIAENDKRFIDKYVEVLECEIVGHDLLHRAPYIDFKFTILNASVYAIQIEESIKGDIYFQSQLLSKEIKMIENTVRHCEHGRSEHFILRQWLSSEEVACILNVSEDDAGEFRFSRLDIKIMSAAPELEINPKSLELYARSLSSKQLRELYRKLDIDIQQSTFTGYYNFDDELSDRGILVNLQVRFVNPRPVRVKIHSFRLMVKINSKDYVAYAEVDEIYEGRIIDEEGRLQVQGRLLKNLNPSHGASIILDSKQSSDGWLQFIIKDVGYDEPKEIPATLTIIDMPGEEHQAECLLKYKN
jgi:hypothetical protein